MEGIIDDIAVMIAYLTDCHFTGNDKYLLNEVIKRIIYKGQWEVNGTGRERMIHIPYHIQGAVEMNRKERKESLSLSYTRGSGR